MDSALLDQVLGYVETIYQIAVTWLLSPAAWSQFVILLVAYILAVIITRRFNPIIAALIAPAEEADNPIATARRFVLQFMPLILPLLAYALTGIGEFVLIPVGALYALGLIDFVSITLQETAVPLGNMSFSLFWILQFAVVASVIFWLGR